MCVDVGGDSGGCGKLQTLVFPSYYIHGSTYAPTYTIHLGSCAYRQCCFSIPLPLLETN